MPSIKLNHVCNMPGCLGLPGQVVTCSQDLADKIIGRGGAVMVDPTAQKKRGPGRPRKQPKPDEAD